MTKITTLILICFYSIVATAQTQPTAQPFGKIDVADLELKNCDFEKGANAMVLFDKGLAYYDANLDLAMERHKRVKIINDNGKDNANIRIEFISGNHSEFITGVQAQTINLVDGKVEITKLDKKLIYTEHVDKLRSALVFSMPNVKAGSVIEYKYTWNSNSVSNFPDWYFQEKIPVRYSEFTTRIPDFMYFKIKDNINQPFVKFTKKNEARSIGSGSNIIPYTLEDETRALANINSLPDEPYMSSFADNLQSIVYQLTSISPLGTFQKSFSDTWAKVGGILADDEDFGSQLKRKLAGEEAIITKAKAMPKISDRIEYIFNEVKNAMKWNGVDRWYTNDGTVSAWEKKTGNSAEVNLILYHLLKQSGVKAYPMVVSTRNHGKVTRYYTFLYQFNRAVVYVDLGDDNKMVLDATSKYNIYNIIPDNILNSDGLYIDKENKKYDLMYLANTNPVRQVTVINADIKTDGKVDGIAQIYSFGYNRINSIKHYKTDGEKKYADYLRENNNNLKISALKFENMETDTLPLLQHINFNLDLNSGEDNYVYFSPNIFTALRANPFLNTTRTTDVEFGYLNNYNVNASFKIPANYKVDAVPKNVTMIMPDSSITFKRIIIADGGTIVARYTVDYKKGKYPKENYPEFFEFNRKMYEMLNEQFVLKKS